ncbi:hypothetical protein ACLOJK_039215, partial [Asimina triloba]
SDRLWVMGSVAGWVPSWCLRPATVAPPAAVLTAGHYTKETDEFDGFARAQMGFRLDLSEMTFVAVGLQI